MLHVVVSPPLTVQAPAVLQYPRLHEELLVQVCADDSHRRVVALQLYPVAQATSFELVVVVAHEPPAVCLEAQVKALQY